MYNPNQYDAVMDKLDNVKPVGTLRDPYIPDGTHEFVILSIEPFRNQEQQLCVRARFAAEKSSVLQPGAVVAQLWNLDKSAPKPGMTTDRDRFVDFICKLQGVALGQHQAACRAVLKPRAEGGNLEAQPARGSRIAGTGVPRVTKTGPNAGKSYTIVDWRTLAQDGAMIAAMRAQLDANPTYQLKQDVVPAQAPIATTTAPAPAVATAAPAGGWLSMVPGK